MAFFEDLSKKMQDVAFAAAEKGREVAAVAAEKGKEVAAVAGEKAQDAADSVKLSVAIAGEQRAIEKNYRAIGEWYVSSVGEDVPEAVADLVRAVRESQARIAEFEAQRAAGTTVEAEYTEVHTEPVAEPAPEAEPAAEPVAEVEPAAEPVADAPAVQE